MPLLFSYGTLRDPLVQRAVFGREVMTAPDELVGFAAQVIRIADPAFAAANGSVHTIVSQTGDERDGVDGAVLELTDVELSRADAYEPSPYERVEAQFRSGRRGWVYAVPRSQND